MRKSTSKNRSRKHSKPKAKKRSQTATTAYGSRKKRKIGRKILLVAILVWLITIAVKQSIKALIPGKSNQPVAEATVIDDSTTFIPGNETDKEIKEIDDRLIIEADSIIQYSAMDSTDSLQTNDNTAPRSLRRELKSFFSGFFEVDEVLITGAHSISPDTLSALMGDLIGKPLFDLDLIDLSARVESHLRVKEATVQTQLPDKVIVKVKERYEILFVISEGKPIGIDIEGKILSEPKPGWLVDVPVVTGFSGELAPGRDVKEACLHTSLNWAAEMANTPLVDCWISEIHVQGSDIQWLRGGNGNIIYPGEHKIIAQVATLNTFLKRDAGKLEDRKIVDLRFPGFLILKDNDEGNIDKISES
ncbi:MAG: FtsQ-type POTRA domain-containing protein [Candidatus Electryonea clarkiae]|nr:FtsQ-type POTRA domain-containing protein [Candidatus Electryonea clarkiae]MDP8288724.1 FtsQ-type POTRA domain-containing protein [Candidatus Electryonea clarkiae]